MSDRLPTEVMECDKCGRRFQPMTREMANARRCICGGVLKPVKPTDKKHGSRGAFAEGWIQMSQADGKAEDA